MPDGADPATLFQAPAAAIPPQVAAPEPPAQPGQGQQPALIDQIPDKFKNPDGTIKSEALLKSYVGMEKVLGEQGDRLGKTERQLQEFLQRAAQPPQPPVQPAQPAAPPAPAPEVPKFPWEVEMTPEEREAALEEYYKDPLAAQAKRDQQTMKAMEHRIGQTLEKVLSPLAPVVERQEYEAEVGQYNKQLAQFAQANPDVQEMLPTMKKIAGMMNGEAIKAMEKAGQNPIKALYETAKALYKPEPAPAPTPEQLINDPNYREKILSDPNIKNEILKSQIAAVQTGAPPPVIGAQLGGMPPAAPTEHAGSAKEAGRMAAKFFGL
jgi:hypothetical protein